MELKMEMSQSLALSQKMIQSTEILQMSSQELELYIKELAIENPVVDLDEVMEESNKKDDLQRKLEWLSSSDEQNRVYFTQDYERKDEWNFSADEGEDLEEYLFAQLVGVKLTAPEMEILEYMICSLDSKGYLTESIDAICGRFEIDEATAEKLLFKLQELEPAGVGARSLKECLLLQMDRQKLEDLTARTIVTDYLEQLGKNQIPQIAKKMKVSVEDILESFETIKSLNPKPGSGFYTRENLKYITPDVTVVRLGGYYEILLNEYMYPKIAINDYYLRMLKEDTSKETKNYIGDKVKQAEWIQNCITQRNRTLLNVTKAIIDCQNQFFAMGPGNLRPMKRLDIAQVLDIHESTVSRAVRDKYLQCSWGVYPMNYFFSKAIATENISQTVTPGEVKQRMQELIEHENKQKPYSDRLITEELKKLGIVISRRTVAKYREESGIKDASGRKAFI